MARPLETYKQIGRKRGHWFRKLLPCVTPVKKTREYYDERLGTEKIVVNSDFRKAFNQRFVFHKVNRTAGEHSHPQAANDRGAAEASIRNFIAKEGLTPYSVSPSQRDIDSGVDCYRSYYSPKDLDQQPTKHELTSQHCIYMIDVDYYTDMHGWLLRGRPVIAYTFVPDTAGGKTVEGSFYFKDNRVHATYNGGGTYDHELWDYNTDHFVIDDPAAGWSLMVKVDQVVSPNDPQRRIVCLTPTTWYPTDYNGKLFESPRRLKRLKVQYGCANILVVQTSLDGAKETECYVSAAYNGVPTSVRLRYDMFTGLCSRLSLDSKPSVSTVERYLNYDGVKDAAIKAPIIFDAFARGWYTTNYEQLSRITRAGVARTAPHYQALEPLLNEEGEDIGAIVERPVIEGAAIFPCRSFNNDVQAVKGRVQEQVNMVVPNKFIQACAWEFITAFPANSCHPISEDEVFAEQDRPLQKVRNEQNRHWLRENFMVRAFMKKESYPKITDPRNISSVPPAHTVKLSRYTYGAKQHLKAYPWYMPGKTPTEISSAMREFVSDCNQVLETDYSRLDGTISEFLRGIERGVYLRMFGQQYHAELNRLMTDEYNARAYTATGTRYDPAYSRLSGSPLTTDGNTLICAFVLYCAARRQKLIDAKASERLYQIPSMIYSDDGVTKKITAKNLELTAKQCGLTLKCKVVPRGRPVTFLARVFVDPWVTDTSVQDPLRALGKLHLSSVTHIAKEIVAVNRAKGYLATDALTPMISNWCRYVIKKYPQITDEIIAAKKIESDLNWWVVNYPDDAWTQHDYDTDLMERVVAESLHTTPEDVREMAGNIDKGDWEPIQWTWQNTIPALVRSNSTDTFVVKAPAKAPSVSAQSRVTV